MQVIYSNNLKAFIAVDNSGVVLGIQFNNQGHSESYHAFTERCRAQFANGN